MTRFAITRAAMTQAARRLLTPATWLRLPRRTARLRLTGLYGALFTAAGAALLGFTFWLFQRATAGAVFSWNNQFPPVYRGTKCQVTVPKPAQHPGVVQIRVPPGCRVLLRNQAAALNRLHIVD